MENEVDLEKEFSYRGVILTRNDYESMPCPMCAKQLDDATMQKIAEGTHGYLIGIGWEQRQVDKYLAPGVAVSDFEGADEIEADAITADYWRFMEKAAIENGMQYYEDMEVK